MRTILLRQNELGTWFVSVTLPHGASHSHHAYASRAQARRAFVIEGRNQPCARMLIRLQGEAKAIVIREGRRAPTARQADLVDLEAIKTALRLLSPRTGQVAASLRSGLLMAARQHGMLAPSDHP